MTNFAHALLLAATLLHLPSMFLSFKKANTTCPEGKYLCKSDGVTCIYSHEVCDGMIDCAAGDDEANCLRQCPFVNDFRCKNGRCILSSWKCDGRDDCGDNSDEDGCPAPESCAKDQFMCGGGECIAILWRCDGENDCSDNSDEAGCHSTSCDPMSQLRCDNGQCIPLSWACDGKSDCFDSTDEAKCGVPVNTCRDDEYFCVYNSRCISKRWICDGDDDCGDGADENPANCTRIPRRQPTECEEFSCGSSGQCIPWSRVCDGVTDCKGATDEGGMCSRACRGGGGCSQVCQKTPGGTKCKCHAGYSLTDDGKTCEDVNECEIPGSCSQFCNNTKGGFECACADGYFLQHDRKRCKADGGAAAFVYLLPDQIIGIDLSTRTQRVYLEGQERDMRGMDYDAEEGIFFWTDWKECTINSYVPSTNRQDVLFSPPVRPDYLRWDWIAKNIYYTDDEGSIVCCSKDGKYCSTVIHEAAPRINSIDISPTTGLMFWTVWEVILHRGAGVLERAELDGSRRMVIVSDNIIWPTAVTVDHLLKMVYWTDAKLNVMECADYHGLKRRIVVSEVLYYPFSMTMFEDYVYWSDWGTDSFFRCDKFGGRNCTSFHTGNAKAEVLMVVHKGMQPKGVNRCGENRCSQLCIPTRSSYVCKCGSDYLEQNSTCVLKSTASPVPTAPSCPQAYCANNGSCAVIERQFYCTCPHPFFGTRCEIVPGPRQSTFYYSWLVVGLSMAALFIYFIFF